MQILDFEPGTSVQMHDGVCGTLVINFERSLFADGYEPGGWEDDQGGLLVEGSGEGLIRYTLSVLEYNRAFYER